MIKKRLQILIKFIYLKKKDMETRLCLECQEPLTGRVDKKFCDDQCRNSYNNRLNSDDIKIVRNINRKLKKNRQILMSLCPSGKSKVLKDKLLSKGFESQYHTHIYQTKEGSIYKFCYEYGTLQIENDYILIVKNEEK